MFRMRIIVIGLIAWQLAAGDFSRRFEEIRAQVTPAELYALWFALPKGGDLHHRNGLSIYAPVWCAAARSPAALRRNAFYTMKRLGDCPDNGVALPRFNTIQRSRYEVLPPCRKALYEPLASLD